MEYATLVFRATSFRSTAGETPRSLFSIDPTTLRPAAAGGSPGALAHGELFLNDVFRAMRGAISPRVHARRFLKAATSYRRTGSRHAFPRSSDGWRIRRWSMDHGERVVMAARDLGVDLHSDRQAFTASMWCPGAAWPANRRWMRP